MDSIYRCLSWRKFWQDWLRRALFRDKCLLGHREQNKMGRIVLPMLGNSAFLTWVPIVQSSDTFHHRNYGWLIYGGKTYNCFSFRRILSRAVTKHWFYCLLFDAIIDRSAVRTIAMMTGVNKKVHCNTLLILVLHHSLWTSTFSHCTWSQHTVRGTNE